MSDIAAAAGSSKATLYRWWPSRESLLSEAFLEHVNSAIAYPDTGSVREDVRRQLTRVIEVFRSNERTLQSLIAAAQWDAELATAFRGRFIAARRADAAAALERGIARGQLPAALDIEVAIDVLYGALYYRYLVSGAELDSAYVERLLDQIWPAISPTAAP